MPPGEPLATGISWEAHAVTSLASLEGGCIPTYLPVALMAAPASPWTWTSWQILRRYSMGISGMANHGSMGSLM